MVKKILWICNVATPEAGRVMKHDGYQNVSWIINLSKRLSERVELIICYPYCTKSRDIKRGKGERITYIEVPIKKRVNTKYDQRLEEYFFNIIRNEKPDCIHIWGTEFPHSFSAMKAIEKLGMLNRTVISIQGLVNICALHYMASLPYNVCKGYSFRDLIKHNNLIDQQKNFRQRGEYEKRTIELARHVIGRTQWDYACVKQINPNIVYHHNNETLREEFYDERWNYDLCEKHSIFMSQGGGYPIKGFHFVLDAMYILKNKYPSLKLCVTGLDLIRDKNIKNIIKRSNYTNYLIKKIKEYGLENNIVFLGTLDGRKMCEQYKKANVFVLASSIENSPNSMGEAMLVGTPCVISHVGGVTTLFDDKKDGYLYPYDEPYMLAYYIELIFEAGKNAEDMGKNARKHALQTHDQDVNLKELLNIYKTLQ